MESIKNIPLADYRQLLATCGYAIAATLVDIYNSNTIDVSVRGDLFTQDGNKNEVNSRNKTNHLITYLTAMSKNVQTLQQNMLTGYLNPKTQDILSSLNINIFDKFLSRVQLEIEAMNLKRPDDDSIVNSGLIGKYDSRRITRQMFLHRYIHKYIVPEEVITDRNIVLQRKAKVSIDFITLDAIMTNFMTILWSNILEPIDNELKHKEKIMRVVELKDSINDNKYCQVCNNSAKFSLEKAFEITNYFGDIFKKSINDLFEIHAKATRININSGIIQSQFNLIKDN